VLLRLVILKRIARRRAVSAEASDEMIEILAQQTHNDMIPARLPDPVDVAPETGWILGPCHDAGIVFVPDGPTYVLVLLSENLEDEDAAVEAFARISRRIFAFVADSF
jgi:beta-lactamase class A